MASTPVAITGAVTIVGYSITLPFVTTDSFTFSFPYLSQDDFEIEVNSETILDAADYEFTSDYLIQLTTVGKDKLNALYGLLTTTDMTIRRRTQVTTRLVDFKDGATLTEADLDLQATQNFYLIQEIYDNSELGNVQFNPVSGAIDLDGAELADVAEPTGESSGATLKTVLDNCITPEYTTAENYRALRMVFESGNLYRSNKVITSAPAIIDLADWDLVLDAVAIATLITDASTNATNIGTNTTNIGTNTTNIGTNTTDIGTNATNLTNHEAENELAHTERDTKANLDTWATTATNGATGYATDEKKQYIVKDTLLVELGAGGGGGLDTFHTEDFGTTVAADFTTGSAATVDAAGTGTLDGAVDDETLIPISGDASLSYTQGVSSVNDFFLQDADISIELKQGANDAGVSFYYIYSGGADDDIRFFVLDQDDVELTSSTEYLKSVSTATRFTTAFYIPAGTTGIRYGFQVVSSSNGAALLVDDFELSLNPFVYKNLVEENSLRVTTGNGYGSTATKIRRFTTIEEHIGSAISYTDSSTDGASFTINTSGLYTISFSDCFGGGANLGVSRNASSLTTDVASLAVGERLAIEGTSGGSEPASFAITKYLNAGDIIRPHTDGATEAVPAYASFSISSQISTEYVVTPAKSNITDWTAYTPIITGFGTPTSVAFEYRQVGDSYEMRGGFTSGTPTAVQGQISLPNAKSITTGMALTNVGDMAVDFAIAGSFHILGTGGEAFVTIGKSSAGDAGLTEQDADAILSSGQSLSFNCTVPIEGLASSATFLAAVPVHKETIQMVDGVTAPATNGYAQIYIDSADGDLKIKFSDGVVKTISIDS